MGLNNMQLQLAALMDHWEQQGISLRPGTPEKTKAFEAKTGIQLPEDFRLFYDTVNGMETLYPNNSDNEGFLFYPVEALATLGANFSITSVPGQLIIFADYLQKSWWYGALINGDEYKIGIVPNRETFMPICNTLQNFIDLYLKNDDRLYQY